MRRRRAVFVTVGTLATSFGILLLFGPETLLGGGPLGSVVSAAETTDPATLALAAGGFALFALLVTARSHQPASEDEGVESGGPVFGRADTAQNLDVDRDTTTAAALEADIENAAEAGGDVLDDVRELLRTTATSACAERASLSEPEAAVLVERGEWTTDPVAAAFLAEEEGPSPSLWMRLRLWLVPEQERMRRIERTVAEIERVATH